MYHIVYLTTNLVNNKIYVGVHSTYNIEDGYLGSGYQLKLAVKKYGELNFKRDIIYYCLEAEHAYNIESQIVNIDFIKRIDTYNIVIGGRSPSRINNGSCSDASKLKNKIASSGFNNPMYGKKHSDITKHKMSIKRIGKKHSIKQRIAQSKRMTENNPFKGKTHSDITKKIIAEKSKERMNNKTQEEIYQMIEYMATLNRGKKRSLEFCENRSKHRKLQFPPTAKKYLLTDKEGNEFIVHGELKSFVITHSLSISLIVRFIDKGVIIGKQSKQSEEVKNTIGWTIQKL